MTKLIEWLLAAFLIFGSWLAIINGKINIPIEYDLYFRWFPFILILSFGMYATLTVMCRVFTFNNCEEAAIELQDQIKEAKQNLQDKGIKLKSK